MPDIITSSPGLLKRFEVVAYGCHEQARKHIRKELQAPGLSIETSMFVEYFCLQPLVISATDGWSATQVYFPYIRRIVEENQFLWCPDNSGELILQPRSESVSSVFAQHQQFVMPAPKATVGTKVFEIWRQHGCSMLNVNKRMFPFRQRILPIDWGRILQQIRLQALGETHTKALLIEFGLIGAPWQQSNHPCLLYAFPIASETIFYGYFILLVPDSSNGSAKMNSNSSALDSCIERLFPKIAKDTYLPVLTLLHESLIEEKLYAKLEEASKAINTECSQLDQKRSGTPAQVAEAFLIAENIPFLNDLVSAASTEIRVSTYSRMESELHNLWNRRLKLFVNTRATDITCERLKQTLLFAQYQVASPGMVKIVCKVMDTAHKLKPPRSKGKSLPAALVFGTPGSGKDTIARMIPLFSPDYFQDDIHTVNMSALKPDFLTGPLIQGLSIINAQPEKSGQFRSSKAEFSIDGILYAATQLHQEDSSHYHDPSPHTKATFILDELNSLDVDLQGILLRILEQGEVTPLFGLARQHVCHLVVGIVNEDPEDISRETEIRDLLLDKGKLGSIFSGLLYEFVRRCRRLRSDLYHRLRRELYVALPSIDCRREDIPILFFHNVTQENNWKDATVELRAYRLLMDSQISWPGNIREIQSVAKRAVSHAEDANLNHISCECVRKALENEFRKLKGKIGDDYLSEK